MRAGSAHQRNENHRGLLPGVEYSAIVSTVEKVRLTQWSHGAGWACKIGPEDLAQVLSHLPKTLANPDVLVGLETGDDAAVYRLRPDLALVVTTDFFTPVVDDAYTFGAIAAANALSDIYAMGAKPLMAVNLVAFPMKELPASLLAEILRGGLDKVREAGIDILGGHSIDDPEPKYALAVTGTVPPHRLGRNGGRPPRAPPGASQAPRTRVVYHGHQPPG